MSAQGHTKRRERREREREESEREGDALNRIISSQIINGIILGCSLGNSGQLDRRGNKERQREEQADRDKGNHVRRRRDEKIQKQGGPWVVGRSLLAFALNSAFIIFLIPRQSLADKQEITALIGLG